jgi:hypothetical protein
LKFFCRFDTMCQCSIVLWHDERSIERMFLMLLGMGCDWLWCDSDLGNRRIYVAPEVLGCAKNSHKKIEKIEKNLPLPEIYLSHLILINTPNVTTTGSCVPFFY